MKTVKDFKIGDKVKYKDITKYTYIVIGFENDFLLTKSGGKEILISQKNANII